MSGEARNGPDWGAHRRTHLEKPVVISRASGKIFWAARIKVCEIFYAAKTFFF
jgi:hypothetical protein